METLYSVLIIFGTIICGYLIVLLQYLLIAIFYKVDIRDHGSGMQVDNAGRIRKKRLLLLSIL